MTDLRSSLIASIEQHDAEHRTANEIAWRADQQAYDLAPIKSLLGQSLSQMIALSQDIMNREWRRIMFRLDRRAFRQRFIRRYRR